MKLKSLILTITLFGSLGVFAQNNDMKPKDTEDWSRKPEVVTPGKKSKAPSDDIHL